MPMSERAALVESKMMRRIQDEIVLCLLSLWAATIGEAIRSRSYEMINEYICKLSIVAKKSENASKWKGWKQLQGKKLRLA